jgi:hypothetical protein
MGDMAMPLTGKAKADYQRDYMRRRRAPNSAARGKFAELRQARKIVGKVAAWADASFKRLEGELVDYVVDEALSLAEEARAVAEKIRRARS